MFKVLWVVFISVFSLIPLNAQLAAFLSDSIYTEYKTLGNTTWLKSEDHCLLIVGEKIIRSNIDQIYTTWQEPKRHFVQKQNKLFEVRENYLEKENKFIEINPNSDSIISKDLRVSIFKDYVLYLKQDSIFLDNFSKPNRTFIHYSGSALSIKNEQYLSFFNYDDQLHYLYDIQNKTKKPISKSSTLHSPANYLENKYYTIQNDFVDDHDSQVYNVTDLKGKIIISSSEKYSSFTSSSDLLVFKSPVNPRRAFYKGKEISLPKEWIEFIDFNTFPDLIFVKNNKGKYGIPDFENPSKTQFIYNNVILYKSNYFYYVETDKKSYLYDKDHKLFYEGAFKDFKDYSDEILVLGNSAVTTDRVLHDKKLVFTTSEDEWYVKIVKVNDTPFIAASITHSLTKPDMKENFYTMKGRFIGSGRINPSLNNNISKEVFKNLNDNEIKKFNPLNVWIETKLISGSMKRCLVDRDGTLLALTTRKFINLDHSEIYLYEVRNGDLGYIIIKEI